MSIKIFANHENKWVATDKEYKKVFASSENLTKLQKKLKELRLHDIVIMFVPPFNKTLAPQCQ